MTTDDISKGATFSGDVAWMLMSSALVFLMTPGLAFFYGGLARNKSALNLISQSMVSLGVITASWFVWSYSLAFGSGGSVYGDLSQMFFSATGLSTAHELAPTIPELLFATYQLMFAIITPALITGATADRFRFGPYILFLFSWCPLVYAPIAHQIWHPNGWLHHLGVLDFAGGIVVHVNAATAALVAVLMLGKRRGYPETVGKPHSPMLIVLGTAILWFGWFGFNAGSAASAGFQATQAFINSQIGAAFAGLAWLLLDLMVDGKATATGLCIGYVAGLATITPACGYVQPLPSMAIGIVGSVIGFFSVTLRKRLGYDDAMDVFAVHGLAAAGGVFLTGVFADDAWTGAISGDRGWLNLNWIQLGIQLAGIGVGAAWSAIGTFVILSVLKYLPGGIRSTPNEEDAGLDMAYHGESLYQLEEAAKLLTNDTKHKEQNELNQRGVAQHDNGEQVATVPHSTLTTDLSTITPMELAAAERQATRVGFAQASWP